MFYPRVWLCVWRRVCVCVRAHVCVCPCVCMCVCYTCLTWLLTHLMKPNGTPSRESHLQPVPHSSPTRLARSSTERQSKGRACSLHPRRDISGDLISLSVCPSVLHSTLERDLPLSPLHSSWQNFKEMGLLTLAVKGHVRPRLPPSFLPSQGAVLA